MYRKEAGAQKDIICIERKVVRKKDGVMKKGDGAKKGKLCINKKIVYRKESKSLQNRKQ